jgi:hypothetical protein
MGTGHTPDAQQRMNIDSDLLSIFQRQVKVIKGKDGCARIETILKH